MRQRNNHRDDRREEESRKTQSPDNRRLPLLHETPESGTEHQEANRDTDDGENYPAIHLLTTLGVTWISAALISTTGNSRKRNRQEIGNSTTIATREWRRTRLLRRGLGRRLLGR